MATQPPPSRSIGIILLSIWLLATGLLAITNLTFALAPVLLGVLAIGAAIFLLLGR